MAGPTEPRKPREEHRVRQGEGSFYFRTSDQRWIGVIDLGRDDAGKRKRIVVSDRDEDTAWQKLRTRRRQVYDQQSQGERRTADAVIDLARSLGQNPVMALVESGHIHESEIPR